MKNSKTLLLVSAVLAVLAISTITYVLVAPLSQEEKEQWEQQNYSTLVADTAEEPVEKSETTAVLEAEGDSIVLVNHTEDTVAGVDARILVNEKNLEEINKKYLCSLDFNTDAADKKVVFSAYKMSMEIPYNDNWGTEKYRFEPYWEELDSVSFGPVGLFEACVWVRPYIMSITNQNVGDLDKVKESFEKDYGAVGEVYTKKINSLDVVYGQDSGMCDYVVMEVIGKKYNYIFHSVCSADIDNDVKYFEEIIKTMKLDVK